MVSSPLTVGPGDIIADPRAAAQISIVQNLTYFEHLSEPMAEFLHILAETYDYPQLADEILRELSNKEFNSNDTRGPKSVSSFIVKLSELSPRLVIKQMTMLAKQLDSEVSSNLDIRPGTILTLNSHTL
jgi:hypothetical protein